LLAVRQSWVNRPLAADEEAQLQKVADLGAHLAPALPLLVYDLQLSATQLGFLHEAVSGAGQHGVSEGSSHCNAEQPELDPDCLTAYRQHHRGPAAGNLHQAVTAGEERHLLGQEATKQPIPNWKRRGLYTPIDIPVCPVQADIAAYETQLNGLVVFQSLFRKPPAYPLTANGTPLEQEMHAELKQSWSAHHRMKNGCAVLARTQLVVQQLQVGHVHVYTVHSSCSIM
jgi:hypothetical protein